MAPNERVIQELIRIRADKQAAQEALKLTGQVREGLHSIGAASQQIAQAEESRAQQTARLQEVVNRGVNKRRVSEEQLADNAQRRAAMTATLAAREQAAFERTGQTVDQITAKLVEQQYAQQEVQFGYDKIGQAAENAARKGRQLAEFDPSRALLGRSGFTEQGYFSTTGLAAGLSRISPQAGGALYDLRSISQAGASIKTLAESSKLAAVSTKTLTLGLGAAGLAIAGVTLGLKLLGDRARESRERIEAQIELEKRLSELRIPTLTTEQIDQQIALLAEETDVRGRLIGQLEADRAELRASLNIVEAFGEATGIWNQGLDQLNDELDALYAQQQQDMLLMSDLRRARSAASTATNDAAAAEARLANARARGIVNRIADEMQSYQRARDMSSEAAQQRLEEIEREREAITVALKDLAPLAGKSEDADEQIRELGWHFGELGTEARRLRDDVLPLIEAREREEEAIERLKDAEDDIIEAREERARIAERLAQTESAYAEEQAQIAYRRRVEDTRAAEDQARADRLAQAQLNADLIALDRKGYQDRARLAENLAKDEDKANQARAKALADFNKRAARDAIDHWRKLNDIEKDARRSIRDAALRLDASAVQEAQRQRADRLADENEQYELERQQRAEDYAERLAELDEQRAEKQRSAQQELRDLERSLAEQRAEKIRAFNEQQQLEAENRRIARQRLLEDRLYEDQLRASAHAKELAALNALDAAAQRLLTSAQNAVNRISSPTASYYQATQDEMLKLYWDAMRNPTAGSLRLVPTPGSGNGYMTLRAYADGGLMRAGTWGIVGERGPELAFAARDTMISPMPGPVTIHIHDARDPERTARLVRRELAQHYMR